MDSQRDISWSRVAGIVGGIVAVVVLVVGAVLLLGDDDDDDRVDSADPGTTETTDEPTTSESTTTTFESEVDPAVAVWPRADTSQRFDDPVAAARSFAVDYVGFTDPIVGELQQGDSRSGEVPVRPAEDAPVTTVLVRQLADDSWFVLGSDTADITLAEPAAGSDIDCPLQLSGEAVAFEGHVDVAVRADAVEEPIGTGFVTGSGVPPAGPFEGTIECDMSMLGASAHHGAILLTTSSAEDGRLWTAEVVRVQLKQAGEAP